MENDLDQAPWPTEWMRGVMELCVLRAIADGPTYGYAIAVSLESYRLGAIKGGTLYPLLGRLERDEWVVTYWGAGEGGPGRKFYELTQAGRDHLDELAKIWTVFSGVVTTYLSASSGVHDPDERKQA